MLHIFIEAVVFEHNEPGVQGEINYNLEIHMAIRGKNHDSTDWVNVYMPGDDYSHVEVGCEIGG